MANNLVSVGHSNTGNVCGGDLTINHSLPCKNGDGMLSYEDYQRFPYCNQCILSFRNQTYFRYQKYKIDYLYLRYIDNLLYMNLLGIFQKIHMYY